MNTTPLGEVAARYLAEIRRRMEANATPGAPAGPRETAPPRPRRHPRKTRVAGPR